MKKRLLAALLTSALALSLTACGGGTDSSATDGGDTASTIAIRSLAHIEQDNVDGDVQVVSHMMATSVMAAHDAIVGKAKRERRLAGMGTTVTSVALVSWR